MRSDPASTSFPADYELLDSDIETYPPDTSSVSERVGEVAQKAADALDAVVAYVGKNDVRDMLADLRAFVRTHPVQAIVVAGVAGFFVGRGLRRH